MHYKKNLSITFLLFFSVLTYAQLPFSSTKSKKADKLFGEALIKYTAMDYYTAAELLNKSLKEDANFIDAWMLLADIKGKNEKYDESIKLYEKVIGLNPDFPLSYYGIAKDAIEISNYQLSFDNINKFNTFQDYFGKKNSAEKIRRIAEFGKEAIKQPVDFKPSNLGSGVNTFENEYWPGLTADGQTLIFTRLIGNSNEDFFISQKNESGWGLARNLGEPINTEQNEGTVSLSPDGQYIFYTACNRRVDNGSCDILLSKLDGTQWSNPINLGPPVNGRTWEAQPSLSYDGKTIYFSSNRPGGFGKTDIWKTTYSNGKWSAPVNLGPEINTDGDEQSPFISKDDQTLYFNSDGHAGMGGIDLFIARKTIDGKWQKASNMGFPINTNKDETCITLSAGGEYAYYVAEKKGGFGGLDIYGFEVPENLRPKKTGYIKGIVFDAKALKKLVAKIELIDLSTGKQVVEAYSNKLTGGFLVCLQGNKDYAMNVSSNGYLFHSENFSLKNQDASDPLTLNIGLRQIATGEKVVLKNIFFDTDKFVLKDESKIEIEKLIEFMNTNPRIKIEVGGHTDNVGDKKKNEVLSNNRAKAVYDYLVSKSIIQSRLSFKGYADTQPIADNKTEAGKKLNRRTEFKIVL